MAEWITWVYFFYMFVSIYFLNVTLILYFKNRKNIFKYPNLTKNYSLSIIVPAFNEEGSIRETIKHIFETSYKNLIEVIVVNDGSKDNTSNVVKKLIKVYGKRLVLIEKENSGKADSLNCAIKIARGEFIGIVDADSYPEKESFNRMIGYFDDLKVGAVTAACTPRNRKTLLEKLQAIEYKVIAITRKLLEYLESIYVVPGSLSIYRTKALKEIGGFDKENLTEDIETTFHLLKNDWKIRMSLSARVTTNVPNKIKAWFRQRVRWTVGGFQVLNKYRKEAFKKNMLGYFVIPFFALGFALAILGMIIFGYLFFKRFIYSTILARYSHVANTNFIHLPDIIAPMSLLNFFGIFMFLLFFIFTISVLFLMKDEFLKKQSFFNLVLYMTIYLISYSIVTLTGIVSWIRGKTKWR
jgi:cellulose synthase/poly-beta-1,6-N-acetylglucosamine synthase-like glycosyltransferase